MRRVRLVAAALLAVGIFTTGSADRPRSGTALTVLLDRDPTRDTAVLLERAILERLEWNDDAPAFPGDRPGSLTALYDSDLDAGRVGWALPEQLTQDDPFIAAAVLEIESEGFLADPLGFFQISWGLWSSETTGFERTGTPARLAGDTFELVEFDYFPNKSPSFGGPFVSAAVFGVADRDHPLFDFLGAFVNLGFGSVQAELPLDVVLLAVLEHRPEQRALVTSVYRIDELGGLLPVPGAVSVTPLWAMGRPTFIVDTLGLTLWRDGFAGPTPSLRARVRFHRLTVRTELPITAAEVLIDARSVR